MKRTLPGLALAACWLLLLLKGPFLLIWIALMLISFVGGFEYVAMASTVEVPRIHKLLVTCIFVIPVAAAVSGSTVIMTAGLLAGFFFLSCYILINFHSIANGFETLSRFGLGLVYIGFLTSHLVLICRMPNGTAWLAILTSITAGSDSGAYYFGRAFGHKKLCSNVSPNKTVEGAIGGLLSALLLASVFALILLDRVDWWFLWLATFVLTGVGIVGDLTESVMKRGTNTKDSGWILAGHGGVLDRVDSLLFAGPLLYYMLLAAGYR